MSTCATFLPCSFYKLPITPSLISLYPNLPCSQKQLSIRKNILFAKTFINNPQKPNKKRVAKITIIG